MADRWRRFGMASACSYGPWQELYHTAADEGYLGNPWDLWDPVKAEFYAREHLMRILHNGAQTVEQVADAWNSGNFRDAIVPAVYIERVSAVYSRS